MDNNEPKKKLISVGELFKSSIDFYKEHWRLLTGIQLIPALLSVLSFVFLRPQVGSYTFVVIIFSLLGAIATSFSWLALMWVVVRDINTTAREAYRKILSYVIPSFVVGFLEALAIIGGFILLIIPGIYLTIAFNFGHYVLFSEDLRGITALKASKYYVKGYWWGVLGRLLLLGICVGLIQIVLGLFSNGNSWQIYKQAIGEGIQPQFGGPAIGNYLSSLVSVFVLTPIGIIYASKIYESLKNIKGNYTPIEKL